MCVKIPTLEWVLPSGSGFAGDEPANPLANLIAHSSECRQPLFLGPAAGGWVV